MREVEKNGIMIDICPSCKGVWLDRGELDKLMADVKEVREEYNDWYYSDKPSQQHAPQYQQQPPQYEQQQGYPPQQQYYGDDKYRKHPKYKKKRSVMDMFGDLFD